jgi:hypothetical protein
MGIDTILVVLLVWSIAGMLAAIAFGKAIHLSTQEDEENLASSSGTVKYFRKNINNSDSTKSTESESRQGTTKRVSG